jgi:1-deoxy-D-xylulose-5-phosphate synthase
VVFALDRAGLVGDDGPTHHGSFDISFLRHIPNLIVMSPRDKDEFIMMLNFAVSLGKPVAIRYPRGRCVESFEKKPETLDLGKGEVLTEGSTLAIMAIGNMVYPAYKAALRLQSEGVSTTVLNARFVKPLDRDKIIEIVTSSEHIITVEENAVAGGFGSSVLELLSREGISKKNVRVLGIPDRFIEQGAQPILRKDLGLDEEGIYKVARSMISE